MSSWASRHLGTRTTNWKDARARPACPDCRGTVTAWGMDPLTYKCDVCKEEWPAEDLLKVPDVATRRFAGTK